MKFSEIDQLGQMRDRYKFLLDVVRRMEKLTMQQCSLEIATDSYAAFKLPYEVGYPIIHEILAGVEKQRDELKTKLALLGVEDFPT